MTCLEVFAKSIYDKLLMMYRQRGDCKHAVHWNRRDLPSDAAAIASNTGVTTISYPGIHKHAFVFEQRNLTSSTRRLWR